jgi:putative RecB family exonuclease
MGHLADRMFRAFQASDFARPQGTIIAIEEELRGDLVPGLPELLARVDLIVDTGEELVVTDFKTSRSQWSAEHVDDAADQLLLYHELVRNLADDRTVRLVFAVLTKTKMPELLLHPLPIDPKQIERTKRVVERIWLAMQAGHYYPNPSPLKCPSCPYRKPCRAWTG